MGKIGVIGAGSWGTALSNLLAEKGNDVIMYDLNKDLLLEIESDRENKRYLPGVSLSDNISTTSDVEKAAADKDVILFSVPAQHFRSALEAALPYVKPNQIIVNVAKGIEQKSLQTISQIASSVNDNLRYVVLSGPSHAEEVGLKMPTTVSVASTDEDAAYFVQDLFITDRFRVYTNRDVLGLELGGSLKNIIALGAGISDGMGFGDNTKAALMTRGIAEMIRLGVRMGADRETFSGLAGIGDLIVTCTSVHSRNRRCGIMIGEGMDPKDAVNQVGMVVEGMFSAEAAYDLAKQLDVEMPITEAIYKVIKGDMNAKTALSQLMARPKRHEHEPLDVL
ncbi:MAG: NAD(P)H-dependent glycerol-3-phosphate dehydrogenase [Clostridiales Family XIII bacterium]|nr:NAD(P)H-dependent glycerol-3-phosphate dehydrogenase [Clostridiales Family XIII bacterium]